MSPLLKLVTLYWYTSLPILVLLHSYILHSAVA